MGMGKSVRLDPKDLAIRFAVGGGAVVLCFIVSKLSPWKAFGGMFAAFPAVMAAAVAMSGSKGGREMAGDTALGAVSGMLAGTSCVGVCLAVVAHTGSWKTAIILGMGAWFAVAGILSSYLTPILAKAWGSQDYRKATVK